MRRALSAAGRQLSRCQAPETGDWGLRAAGRIGTVFGTHAPRRERDDLQWRMLNGGGCHGHNRGSPWHIVGGGEPAGCSGGGDEDGAGGGTACMLSMSPLSSSISPPRCAAETVGVAVAALRHRQRHLHGWGADEREDLGERRGFSSAARPPPKDTTAAAAAAAALEGAPAPESKVSGLGEGEGEGSGAQPPPPPPPPEHAWGAAPEAAHTWVDRTLPPGAVPFAKLVRFDRPIGTFLLAWPCFWSIALAAPPGALPDATLLALFGVGSLLLRGAGCTINDLWDRDIDALVARTRNRPIASGAVSPLSALVFLSGQLSAGLGVLLQLNDFSKVLGASSLALVAAYPLMKRITHWPQLFLGLTLNWGALLGWAAVHGTVDPHVVAPLYASGVAWTLLYDTVYAHQDKKDDARVGVKSTALLLGTGAQGKGYLAAFATVSAGALVSSGAAAGLGWPFYVGAGAAAAHMAWQVGTVDLDDGEDCAAKFRSNAAYGGIVFAAIVAGKLVA